MKKHYIKPSGDINQESRMNTKLIFQELNLDGSCKDNVAKHHINNFEVSLIGREKLEF